MLHLPWNCRAVPSPGHPCAGQLSVADVRLRLSHTIHNTEGGKRVHSVVTNTSRVVADTSKVVAVGLGAAKVTFTSSRWTVVNPAPAHIC
jgi:hypothetical protein